jgi:hypothetical protein
VTPQQKERLSAEEVKVSTEEERLGPVLLTAVVFRAPNSLAPSNAMVAMRALLVLAALVLASAAAAAKEPRAITEVDITRMNLGLGESQGSW